MMRLLLLVAAAALALYAVIQLQAPQQSARVSGEEALLPGLDEQVNAIEGIELIGAGNMTLVTLTRSDQAWHVEQRQKYPADLSRVREALLTLASARLAEPRTVRETLYARLGVEPISEAEAQGVLLRLSGVENIPEVILGTDAGSREGTHVRRVDNAQSWLAVPVLDLPREVSRWLDPALLDVDGIALYRVRIEHADGEMLTLRRAHPSHNFTLLDIPEGRELSSPTIANPVAATLEGLRLRDVRQDDGSAASLKAEFATFDGLLFTLERVLDEQDKAWLRIAVALDPERAEQSIRITLEQQASLEVQNQAEGEAQAEVEEALDPALIEEGVSQLRAEAEALHSRLSGWLYEVAAFKLNAFDRRIEDLLAEAPVPEPNEAIAPALESVPETQDATVIPDVELPASLQGLDATVIDVSPQMESAEEEGAPSGNQ